MTVLTAIVPLRSGARTLDVALCAGLVAIAAAIGWYAAASAHGLIPAQNMLYDADTGRVLADYTGQSPNYYRLKVHPWQGWLFALQQIILAPFIPAPVAVPLISIAIASISAGLLYVVMRRLEVGAWAAASYTMLFCAMAGHVVWSSVPEAHMAGGFSTLVAVLLLTGENQSRRRSILALAVSFSMVVTNAMVWLLRRIDLAPLRRGWRAFVDANRAHLPDLLRQAMWAIGVVPIVWAPQWPLLQKRIGIPFNFYEERHYIEIDRGGIPLHVLGIFPPDGAAAVIAALIGVAVLVAAFRILPVRLWFVPAFPLFGVILHTVYGRDSAFLFSPNYLPLFVASLALVGTRVLPKWAPAALVPVAALLLAVNLSSFKSHIDALAAGGQMKSYQAAVHYE